MKRNLLALTIVAAAACFDVSSPIPPTLILSPILDSLFVGDSLVPRDFAYYNSDGERANPGPLSWSIGPTSVATINATTGVIHGVGKGVATVIASGGQAAGIALVAVSRPLDLTLLMDTVVLMQQDTFTIPVAIQKKAVSATDTVWFDPSPSPRVTINTSTGLVTAVTSGGAVRYVAHVTSGGADTVSDTGAVVVLGLADTTSPGHFFQTVLGTAIRHEGGAAVGVNYARLNGRLNFRLLTSALSPDSTLNDSTIVTLKDSLIRGDTTFEIDSLGLDEARGSQLTLSPVCNPRRPWALWRSDHYVTPLYTIFALSHGTLSDSVAGSFSITQFTQAAGGGAIISGRYFFLAQRTDLYNDPLGVEVIRGTFVAPLLTRQDICQG
ncbi:MAG TPA: hypothetical protein VN964_04320 [Gemmatimonadales bacterium]|nr:hypothetical protein [Gemmatimonadales bacterium]